MQVIDGSRADAVATLPLTIPYCIVETDQQPKNSNRGLWVYESAGEPSQPGDGEASSTPEAAAAALEALAAVAEICAHSGDRAFASASSSSSARASASSAPSSSSPPLAQLSTLLALLSRASGSLRLLFCVINMNNGQNLLPILSRSSLSRSTSPCLLFLALQLQFY